MNSSSALLHPPCWDLEKLPCLLALFAYCLAQELFEQSWTVNAMVTNLASSWHQGEKRFYLQLFWAALARGKRCCSAHPRDDLHRSAPFALWQAMTRPSGLSGCSSHPPTPFSSTIFWSCSNLYMNKRRLKQLHLNANWTGFKQTCWPSW